MIDRHLICTRILGPFGLAAPPEVRDIETMIAALSVGRSSVRCGLELLAEHLGHFGNHEAQRKYARRRLDFSERWQKRNGVQLSEVDRGKRNQKGLVTTFFDNHLNKAAFSISNQLAHNDEHDPRPDVVQIDELVPDAIQRFLRRPLAVLKPEQPEPTPTPTPISTPKDEGARGAGVSTSWDICVPIPDRLAGLIQFLKRFHLRGLPVEGKKSRISNYGNAANSNPVAFAEWEKRWPGSDYGILTGSKLPEGFLVTLDFDRHDPNKDGFKTKAAREAELGSLPVTLTVKTPSNGEHWHFWSEKPIRNSNNGLIGPGIDIRGMGGIAVAPGSAGYAIATDAPIARLPERWEIALRSVRRKAGKVRINERHRWLRGCAWAMANKAYDAPAIFSALQFHRGFTCEQGGREITDQELQKLTDTAVSKVLKGKKRQDVAA